MITAEMSQPVPWGIPKRFGGIDDPAQLDAINAAEQVAIKARRCHYLKDKTKKAEVVDKAHAVALALSGGGIRSATFSLGVLVALARRNLLPQIQTTRRRFRAAATGDRS